MPLPRLAAKRVHQPGKLAGVRRPDSGARVSGLPAEPATEPAAPRSARVSDSAELADQWSDRLDAFVAAYLDLHPDVACETMFRLLGWARRPGGQWEPTRWAASFIGRYENLARDLVLALQTAGQPFDRAALLATAPQRVGAREPLREATRLSPALRARILAGEPALCREIVNA